MRRILWAFVGALVVTIGLSAQESNTQGQGSTSPATPAPTAQAPAAPAPTTPAPAASASANADKANADKKVTFSGCIERQPPSAAAITGTPTMPFMLANASAVGANGPVGTSGGSTGAASAATGKSYRLDAAESVLSPHVGHKVEITGTIEEQPASPAGEASAGSRSAAAAKLKVDSLKMVSTNCQ
jgi:hypothetical protein